MQWDECRVTYGWMAEELNLTQEQELSLGQMLFDHSFEETDPDDLSASEMLFGGYLYQVEFKDGDKLYSWSLSPNFFVYTVTENEEVTETRHYLPDSAFIERLRKLLRPMG